MAAVSNNHAETKKVSSAFYHLKRYYVDKDPELTTYWGKINLLKGPEKKSKKAEFVAEIISAGKTLDTPKLQSFRELYRVKEDGSKYEWMGWEKFKKEKGEIVAREMIRAKTVRVRHHKDLPLDTQVFRSAKLTAQRTQRKQTKPNQE